MKLDKRIAFEFLGEEKHVSNSRLLMKNVCYHLFSRGSRKKIIFNEESDYLFYLRQLKRYKKKYGFCVYGYCLMPNHIHIIGEPNRSENLSKMMHGLQLFHTVCFNRKYKKVGHLWQGRFKSKVIMKDQSLMNGITYVEQNPVRAKIVAHPSEYKFSSFKERQFGDNDGMKLLENFVFD